MQLNVNKAGMSGLDVVSFSENLVVLDSLIAL